MNTWKIILATMVIFGAGVVTGGLLVRNSLGRSAHTRPPAQMRPALPVSAGGIRLEFLRRVQKELELTAEQRERLDKVIKESQERSRRLMEPVAPQLRQELQLTRERFREVLTAEQRARFDELVKHQQRPRDQQRHSVTNQLHALPEQAVSNP